MNLRSIALASGLGLALTAAASPAAADTSPTAPVSGLMVIEAGDRNYKLFHGAVWLEQDKATTNYRWGGAQCGGRDISATTIQLLFSAFRSGDQVTIEFIASDFKGKPYRCVTAVTFSKT